MGLYGSAIFGLVPQVLAAFRSTHPDVELVLHHAQTPAQIPALRQGRVLLERNYQARYDNPGQPVLQPNAAGRSVIRFDGQGRILMSGPGATPPGSRPAGTMRPGMAEPATTPGESVHRLTSR